MAGDLNSETSDTGEISGRAATASGKIDTLTRRKFDVSILRKYKSSYRLVCTTPFLIWIFGQSRIVVMTFVCDRDKAIETFHPMIC